MLGTGFISDFYTSTLHALRSEDRVKLVYGRSIDKTEKFAKKWGIDSLAVGVLWPAALSFIITVVLGYGLSFVMGKNTEASHNYTRNAVMAGKND